MAQNVTVAGASYSDVPSVVLPKTGGGSAGFFDVSDTTATIGDVSSGKVLHLADGTVGTGQGYAYLADSYNSSTKTLTLTVEPHCVAWWGSLDHELLYETEFKKSGATVTLADMDYSSLDPSADTSAHGMKYQFATDYTATNNANPTFDRWGSSYHSGSALNFAAYDYFVLQDVMVDVAYTVTESSMGKVHALKQYQTFLNPIGQRFRINSSNQIVTPTTTTYGTTTALALSVPMSLCRNASNNLTVAASVSYGIYPGAAAPTFQSTGALTSTYINFRAPSLSVRTNSSYMASTAWASVSASNTTIRNRQRLYRVRKQDLVELAYLRMESMIANGEFPTEVI